MASLAALTRGSCAEISIRKEFIYRIIFTNNLISRFWTLGENPDDYENSVEGSVKLFADDQDVYSTWSAKPVKQISVLMDESPVFKTMV